MVVVAPLAPTGTSPPAWNDAWFIGVAAPDGKKEVDALTSKDPVLE